MNFPETGILRIEEAFARDDAAMMCDVLACALEREFASVETDRRI